MQLLQERSGVSLDLTGAIDIHTVDGIRTVLLEHLRQEGDIVVDLSRVESCDAAGAQLLIALEKSAESAGKQFSIAATSESFVRDCASIGIQFTASAPPATAQSKSKNPEAKKPRTPAKKRSTKKLVGAAHE